MPVSFHQIINNSSEFTFTYDSDSVTIVYYPGRVTDRVYASFSELSTMDAKTIDHSLVSLNESLAYLIKSWDVYEDASNSVMFPIDAKRFADLPVPFKLRCLLEVMTDMRPEGPTPQN